MISNSEVSGKISIECSSIREIGMIQNQGIVLGLSIIDFNCIMVVLANEDILDCPWVTVKTMEDLLSIEISKAFDATIVEGLSNLLFKYQSLDDSTKLNNSHFYSKPGKADSPLDSVQVMSTDTIIYENGRQLRLAIVDCSTPQIYLFEIEYVDQIQIESDVDVLNQPYQLKCHVRESPSDCTDYSKSNSVNLKDITGAFCDTAMEILNVCDLAIACTFSSAEIISERIRENVQSTVHSQLGTNYPSSFFANKDLLLKSRSRIVYNVNSAGSKVFGYNLKAIDLSQTKFCNPTVPCLQFMRKMGIQSTITVAIEVQGNLWGVYIIQSIQRPMIPTYEHCVLLEAAAANSSLRIASVAREDFISHMSHELRTPLHGIMSALQILQSSKIEANDRLNILNCAIECSQSMLANLNDILAIARGNRKNSQDRFSRVSNFLNTLSTITEGLKPMATSKSVKLEVFIDSKCPLQGDHESKINLSNINLTEFMLRGHENLLSKIFQNLVSNAIKFSHAGGLVSVRVSLAPSFRTVGVWNTAVCRYASSYVASQRGIGSCAASLTSKHEESGWFLILEVEDTGCGVCAASMQNMFNAFEQLSSGVSKTYQGIGLGLHIARQHTDTFNGMLGVCSTVGSGTLFFGAFPIQFPKFASSSEQNLHMESTNMSTINVSDAAANLSAYVTSNESARIDMRSFDQSIYPKLSESSFCNEVTATRYVSGCTEGCNGDVETSEHGDDVNSNAKKFKSYHTTSLDYSYSINDSQFDSISENYTAKPPIIFLLVDDSPFNNSVLQRKIKLAFERDSNIFVQCKSAANGSIAVDIYNSMVADGQHHLLAGIFMDYQMPVCNGVDAISRIRAIEGSKLLRQVHIVLLTADSDVLESYENSLTQNGSYFEMMPKPTPSGHVESICRKLVTARLITSSDLNV